jgi:hypothetical protein
LNYWISEIERIIALGLDVKEGFIALGKLFFNSSEYVAKNKNTGEYIIDLYETFLHRTPEKSEINYWIGEIDGGLTRNLVLNNFIFSEEFLLFMEEVFCVNPDIRPEYELVNDLYRGFLSRLPEDSGFNFWLNEMQVAQCNGEAEVRDLTNQIGLYFIHSPEYADRNSNNSEYIEDLYNAILRRGADVPGYIYWLDSLNSGDYTRESLLSEFVISPEFQVRVQEIIDKGCI